MEQEQPKRKYRNARQEADALIAEERVKALSTEFKPSPSDEWRLTKSWWTKATEDERKDMLYGLTFYSSAKPKTIAKYFSIDVAELKPYQEQIQMGEAARILKINAHQMRWAIQSNVPNAKFFLGMQFAGQVQNPVHDDAPSLDEKKDSNIKITVIGKEAVNSTTGDDYDGDARSGQSLQ